MGNEPDTSEVYEVVIVRDPVTGKIVGEAWHRPNDLKVTNGQIDPEVCNRLHRTGGPALVRYDRTTGVATEELWWRNGHLHREDGPAKIHRDALTGRIKSSSWYNNGQRVARSERPPPRSPKAPLRQGPK